MKELLKSFQDDESGATAIEYGLIAALISVGIIAAVSALGGSLQGIFSGISGQLTDAADGKLGSSTTQNGTS